MILVCRAHSGDLPLIHRIREQGSLLFPTVSRESFERQIWGAATYRGRNVLVAQEDGKLLGYASFVERAVAISGDFYVWHLGAVPGAEGTRAARELVQAARRKARRLRAARMLTSCLPGDRERQSRLRASGFSLAYDFLDLEVAAPFRFKPPPPRADFELRDLVGVDAERFRELYWSCFRGVWNAAPMTRDEVRELLEDPGLHRRGSFIALRDGRYLGFVVNRSETRGGQRTGELWAIGVRSSARGHGFGAELLRRSLEAHAERGATAVHLRVASPNAAARKLYRRAGFRLVRKLHVYAAAL